MTQAAQFTNQLGMFDVELNDCIKAAAAEDAAIHRARAERFERRKATLLADTKSWDGGPFSERICALLKVLLAVGKEAEGMHDAILSGINSAGNAGRLTEQHVAFVEGKARIEVARVGSLVQVKPVVWRDRVVADLGTADFGSGQLPLAIQQAAVDRLNVLGPQLAGLGYLCETEVNAASPTDARELGKEMMEVRQALMTLAPARYRHAKGHKLSSKEKLDRTEAWVSSVLRIDTLAHPGIDTSVQLTADGVRSIPVKSAPRTITPSETAATEAVVAKAGHHVGPIVKMNDHSVAQKTGRNATKLTWHALLSLVGHSPQLGDLVEISYKNGVGHVANQTLAREQASHAR